MSNWFNSPNNWSSQQSTKQGGIIGNRLQPGDNTCHGFDFPKPDKNQVMYFGGGSNTSASSSVTNNSQQMPVTFGHLIQHYNKPAWDLLSPATQADTHSIQVNPDLVPHLPNWPPATNLTSQPTVIHGEVDKTGGDDGNNNNRTSGGHPVLRQVLGGVMHAGLGALKAYADYSQQQQPHPLINAHYSQPTVTSVDMRPQQAPVHYGQATQTMYSGQTTQPVKMDYKVPTYSDPGNLLAQVGSTMNYRKPVAQANVGGFKPVTFPDPTQKAYDRLRQHTVPENSFGGVQTPHLQATYDNLRRLTQPTGARYTDIGGSKVAFGGQSFGPWDYPHPFPPTPTKENNAPTNQNRNTNTSVKPPYETDYDKALNFSFANEGGFSDRKNDLGGKTFKGVSQKWYDQSREQRGLPTKDVRNLTNKEIRDYYYSDYWQQSGANKLPYPHNVVVFDNALPMGPETSKNLYKQSGGNINRYLDLAQKHYTDYARHTKGQMVNLEGWLNRVDAQRRYVNKYKRVY